MKSEAIISTSIPDAVQFLLDEEVVAIPTETVYGLAGNALSRDAVVKIFEVKARPAFDPLIVHTHSADEFEKYASPSPEVLKWVEKLSPGPVTYILPKKEIIPDLVTSGHPSVGLRIPRHPLTLELLKSLPFPLAAPSANPFGYVSPTEAGHVFKQLGEKIPYILDGGPCDVGIESTILDLTTHEPKILRLGGYDLEELEDILQIKLNNIQLSSSAPHAPGMLQSHYSPSVKLYNKSPEELLKLFPDKRVGALRYSCYSNAIDPTLQLCLSPMSDPTQAAKNLFRMLRMLDEMDVEIVSVENAPEVGLGKAINDRLKRATEH